MGGPVPLMSQCPKRCVVYTRSKGLTGAPSTLPTRATLACSLGEGDGAACPGEVRCPKRTVEPVGKGREAVTREPLAVSRLTHRSRTGTPYEGLHRDAENGGLRVARERPPWAKRRKEFGSGEVLSKFSQGTARFVSFVDTGTMVRVDITPDGWLDTQEARKRPGRQSFRRRRDEVDALDARAVRGPPYNSNPSERPPTRKPPRAPAGGLAGTAEGSDDIVDDLNLRHAVAPHRP